jgi:RimJ/RimL family protein N-acetyltransferase
MIRTERLLLRPVVTSDVDRLMEFWNLPEVTNWLLRGPSTAHGLREWVVEAARDPHDHSHAALLDLGDDADHVLVGVVNLRLETGYVQPGGPEHTVADVGYTFDPAYAGRGYATEAVSAMLGHAFEVLGARRARAGAFADNHASVRVLEKLGMRREEHAVRDSWHAEHGWIDGVTYALLADER